MKYVAPTTLKNPNGWLANPIWGLTDNAKILEIGWFDGYPVGSPICYWALNGVMQPSWGSPSTSLATYQIDDSNGDEIWSFTACGQTKISADLNSNKLDWIRSGYETTHDQADHNVNTGETKDTEYLASGGIWAIISDGNDGTATKFLNPGTGFMWVHFCGISTFKDDFMYGDGLEENPC